MITYTHLDNNCLSVVATNELYRLKVLAVKTELVTHTTTRSMHTAISFLLRKQCPTAQPLPRTNGRGWEVPSKCVVYKLSVLV